ncbi:MAG: energy transducer TonB [Terriglobia bacterium]
MFEQLLESTTRRPRRNPWAYAASLVLQTFILGVMILIPLLYTEALPRQQLLSWVVAPPPPPPPPPPPATEVQRRVVRKVSLMEAGKLRAPKKIPERITKIVEEETPVATGVVGGVPGVAGGQLGGVIGGVIGSIPAPPPPPPVKRIRVSMGVQSAKKINHVNPVYPPLARQARIQGTVRLEAIIAKDGSIQNLNVLSGHPLLVQAALDAVQRWRYEPTLLNNQPVEVVTYIDVHFRLY